MWITWGADTAHLLPRLIASRERGPLFLSEHRPAHTGGPPPTRATSARRPAELGWATTAPASCSPTTATGSDCTSSATPPGSARAARGRPGLRGTARRPIRRVDTIETGLACRPAAVGPAVPPHTG
jgi:hypothetical protein